MQIGVGTNHLGFQNQNPQFKSVYPVVHWVAETNGSYAPALTEKLSRTLNRKLVSMLNTNSNEITFKIEKLMQEIGQLKEKLNMTEEVKQSSMIMRQIKKLEVELASSQLVQRVRRFVTRRDSDYAENHYVRTFYNSKGGIKNGKFEPIVYLLTGRDAVNFEETYGKPLGQLKKQLGLKYSAEIQSAKIDYWLKGLNYVKQKSQKSCGRDGLPHELHIKTETVRSKTGNIKGYNIVNMEYFPNQGTKNPFVLTGMLKEKK